MRKKILVVEDNMVNRNILLRILQDDYEVVEATNGQEAYEIIQKDAQNLAAVILDLVMPVMDGKALLKVMKDDGSYSNLPILIATGEHNEETETECLALGAWDFIAKPYGATIIKMRLENIIARSQNALMMQIQKLAQRDTLTGLYNRQYFMNQTSVMLKANMDTKFVLVRMDIDHFRLYNSSFGSKAGNQLLIRIAQELIMDLSSRHVNQCTYGRIESDVFCMCVPYTEEMILNAIHASNKKLQTFSEHYRIKASFGLYVIEDNLEDMEAMYTRTVEASAKCKHNLTEEYAFYSEKMSQLEENEQKYTNEIDRALKEKQFQVYLQPKYSVETGKPCGAEALVRWLHPEWGMVSPGAFIPAFEHNGLIVQLDYYMWESVCELLSRWQKSGEEVYPISVNISRISMYNPNIVDDIYALTQKYQVSTQLLNLEITESAYMSNPKLMEEIIGKFRALGFVILMDDFGSGYSSLNTLKNIEVDILKIDMKFLPTGQNNVKSEKILASVARMAGWLGMPVIVEGVETKEQKDFVESIGCNYIQGYYYARPMPVQDYVKLISKQQSHQDIRNELTLDILKPFDELWSSDSSTGMLLRSVAVPFVIAEYGNAKLDVLRKNEAFQKEFGIATIDELLNYKEQSKLINKIEELVLSKDNGECDLLFTLPNGANRWHHIRIVYVGTIGKTSLLSMTLTDVTAERMMENEINHIFRALEKTDKGRNSLLIVDDVEISREILASLFEDNYHIILASDGEEALQLLKENCDKIAAILLDMLMPEMNGEQFLGYKNNIPEAADIPVIVISSETSQELQINMLEQGVNDYVTKPFIPAVVNRRVKNVIEYNSRFRHLVKEYNERNHYSMSVEKKINLTEYSHVEIGVMIEFLKNIFDIVRLVDPTDTAVIRINENGEFKEEPYSCFKVWGKTERCENCTSMCSLDSNCRKNKFELMKENMFYVISQPVEVIGENGDSRSLVLEIVSKITDEENVSKEEVNDMFAMLASAHRMIYTDPLTNAFNRRFLDETQFLHNKKNQVARQVAVIMLDINHFKEINDTYGHLEGDKILKQVADAISGEIREEDSLIRYGGDEFVIILTNCKEEQVEISIERFRNAISKIVYGSGNESIVSCEFGYDYTEDFVSNGVMLDEMLKKADERMYTEKKKYHEGVKS